MFYIVGLGNPGQEYEESRHNVGRFYVKAIAKINNLGDFEFDKKSKSLVLKTKIYQQPATLILPETFMNKSGEAVGFFIKAKTTKDKSLPKLIVVYDDLDLPIGSFKISYNKGSGGHRGLESIIKATKTKEFVRLRIGISKITSSGKIKKPGSNLGGKLAEKEVLDFILGSFKPVEKEILKKNIKKINEAIDLILTEGREKAMNQFN